MTDALSPPAAYAAPLPPPAQARTRPFHTLAKPIGPACNLRCTYCFYLDKSALFPSSASLRMPDDVLENFIRDYIRLQDAAEISFAWQGGEPTLLGIDFFRKVLTLQQRFADGRPITNALQTNATLIDDAWGEFLAEHGFLVGVSIDGPAELHDSYRIDPRGGPSFARVRQGIEKLKQHRVEFNTLTVVNRRNVKHPLKVYRFLKDIGARFIQFIPLVEREVPANRGGGLASPPCPGERTRTRPAPWSVMPVAYGNFLTAIFDEWVREDVGSTFVQLFDNALGSWLGHGSSLCVFAETCGRAIAIEHDGSVYACDHYVYPQYRLGRLGERTLANMVDSPAQRKFGADKRDTLPAYCRRCEFRFACHGECPKHRFLDTPDGEPGLNYLCAGYRHFFRHIDPYMRKMAELLRQQRPAAQIMALARQWQGRPPRTGRPPPPTRS